MPGINVFFVGGNQQVYAVQSIDDESLEAFNGGAAQTDQAISHIKVEGKGADALAGLLSLNCDPLSEAIESIAQQAFEADRRYQKEVTR